MLTSKPEYGHRRGYVSSEYRVIVNIEEYEWRSVDACLLELACLKGKQRKERHARRKYKNAVRREEQKLLAVKKKLALAKFAILKERQR